MQADFDHLGAKGVNLADLRARAEIDPHVLFSAVSPSGDGLKLFFHVDSGVDDHTAAFLAMQRYCLATYGIEPDGACKDVPRLCFLPSDPELYVNERAVPLDWRAWMEPAAAGNGKPKRASNARSESRDGSKPGRDVVRSMLAVIPKRPDYPDWLRIVAAVGDALNEQDAEKVLNEWSPEENPGEYLEKLQSGMAQVHVGTLIHIAQENGWSDWPDIKPLPPEHPPVMPFDFEMLPDAFKSFVADTSRRMSGPPDFVAVALMVSAGALIGNRVCILPKKYDTDWREVGNLWGMIVGQPSVLKTPSLKAGMVMLDTLAVEDMAAHRAEMEDYNARVEAAQAGKEDRKKRLAATMKEKGEEAAVAQAKEDGRKAVDKDKPKERRLIVNDATPERLQEIQNENPSGVLNFRDELSGFLLGLEKEGHENARTYFLESWSGLLRYRKDTISRGGTDVERNTLSILGGIQPGPLASYVRDACDENTGADGLMQRFSMVVWPELAGPFKLVDEKPNQAEKEKVMLVFRRLRGLTTEDVDPIPVYKDIMAVHFSPAAQEVFNKWVEDIMNRTIGMQPPALAMHLVKYKKLVATLALVIHFCDGGSGAVGLASLNKALLWQKYLESHAVKLYSGLSNGGVAPAREILRRIKRRDIVSGFTARDISQRRLGGLSTENLVGTGLDALLVCGALREKIVPTEGRYRVTFEVNPALLLPDAPAPEPE